MQLAGDRGGRACEMRVYESFGLHGWMVLCADGLYSTRVCMCVSDQVSDVSASAQERAHSTGCGESGVLETSTPRRAGTPQSPA